MGCLLQTKFHNFIMKYPGQSEPVPLPNEHPDNTASTSPILAYLVEAEVVAQANQYSSGHDKADPDIIPLKF